MAPSKDDKLPWPCTEAVFATGNILLRGGSIVWSTAQNKKDKVIGILQDLIFANPATTVARHGPRLTVSAMTSLSNGRSSHESTTRSDLDISAKLFYLKDAPDPSVIRCALDTLFEFIPYLQVDTLVMSWPGVGRVARLSGQEDCEDKRRQLQLSMEADLKLILPAYREVEAVLRDGIIGDIGVAEFSAAELRILKPLITIQPTVNHVDLVDCCVVEEDLRKYAEDHDITLMSHSDPPDILPSEKFESLLRRREDFGDNWCPDWVIKYSIIAKSTGVVTDKGFVIFARRDSRDL